MVVMTRQEIEVWEILPAIRREYARSIVGAGLSQRKAAEILNVTDACISQYLKSKRGSLVNFPRSVLKEINRSAEMIIKDKAAFAREIQKISDLEEIREIVCKIHKKRGCVSSECDICKR